MIPAAEVILVDYLNAHPDVTALGAHVGTKTPDSHVDPWLRVTQLDGRDIGGVEHLIDSLVQIDCFAGDIDMGNHVGAMAVLTLARTVRAAVKAMQGQTIGGAVVSGVTFVGWRRGDDFESEPARDRWTIMASIGMHS